MTKAFISDFDGTLYLTGPQGSYFLKEDLDAIADYQKKGNLFGFCTGRPLSDLAENIPTGLNPDFCIVSSGAMIVKNLDPSRSFSRKIIDAQIMKEVYSHIEHIGKAYIHTAGSVFVFKEIGDAMSAKVQRVLKDPDDILGIESLGLSIGAKDEDRAMMLAEEIKTEFGRYVMPFQNKKYLDIVASDCSKGMGIKEVRNIFGLSDVYSIGDSYNDIPLLKEADHSFTFTNSPEIVKKHADRIVGTVSEAIKIADSQ